MRGNHLAPYDCLPHVPFCVVGDGNFEAGVVYDICKSQRLRSFPEDKTELNLSGLREIVSVSQHSAKDVAICIVRDLRRFVHKSCKLTALKSQ